MAKKICLDAGHYGKYNRSPAVREYYESDMTWKLHLLLKKYLEGYGFEVITTRSNKDTDKTLYKRGTTAKGCDLFLSLHSNAAGSGVNENVDRVDVYAPLSGKGHAIARKLADCIAHTMGTKQGANVKTKQGSSGGEYYGVIRGAVAVGTIGLLVEHSFHTCTRSAMWLLDDNNLDKLARAEAEVIAKHFGTTEQPVEKPVEKDEAFKPYRVKIATDELNVRKGPGTKYDVELVVHEGDVYTIVDETSNGSTRWGKLKSGAGWISLKYTEKA